MGLGFGVWGLEFHDVTPSWQLSTLQDADDLQDNLYHLPLVARNDRLDLNSSSYMAPNNKAVSTVLFQSFPAN